MKTELTEQQISSILKMLDDAIEDGPWDESNFLKVIGKNLREIRENFIKQVIESSKEKVTAESNLTHTLHSGLQEVFVALYSTEGNTIQSWERIIANLPKQVISRPIYANEYDIQFLIKSKENKINEAYLSIFINQNDILPLASEKVPMDKFGKPLITLKDRAINLNNITRFIHLSGAYKYVKGRLVKMHNPESEK